MASRSAFALVLAVAVTAFYGCEAPGGDGASASQQQSGAESASVEFSSYLAGESAYGQVREYIETAAEEVDEADYGYRPTEEVRSFGELIGHLASARYAYCGAARDEDPPEGPAEDASKEELVDAIRSAGEYCAETYGQATDASLSSTVQIFGNEARQLDALMGNLIHENQHYGNIVTYMREMGMVPPSSQG